VALCFRPASGAEPSFTLSSLQGIHSVGSRRLAMDPATPCFQSSSATPCRHALVVRHRSNVSQATSIRGARATCSGQPDFKAGVRCTPQGSRRASRGITLGLGCRCGRCDDGYYNMWGQCLVCGSAPLVFFLSYVVPALGTVAGTAFLFWAGAPGCRAHCCPTVEASGILQLSRAADCSP
jgi:hypothetical protein